MYIYTDTDTFFQALLDLVLLSLKEESLDISIQSLLSWINFTKQRDPVTEYGLFKTLMSNLGKQMIQMNLYTRK